MTDFDFSQLTRLAADLGHLAEEGTAENVRTAVEQSARRVKDRWNGKLYREGHAKLTGRSISYDVGAGAELRLFATDAGDTVQAGEIVAEIGPKRLGSGAIRARAQAKFDGEQAPGGGRQAGIVRLLENGSAHNAPHGYGSASLQEEEADFAAGIAFAVAAREREVGFS